MSEIEKARKKFMAAQETALIDTLNLRIARKKAEKSLVELKKAWEEFRVVRTKAQEQAEANQ